MMKQGKHIISAESKEFRTEYTDWEGKRRNYFPDYVIDGIVYEIKPSGLVNTKTNNLKFNAAREKFGTERFIILTENDVDKISDSTIKFLYDNNEIKFIQRYEEKYKERYAELS